MKLVPVKLVLAFFVLALPTLFAGCGNEDSSQSSSSAGLPDEITIGAAIGKTGYLVPYDSNIAAVEQLVDETNAKGGIDGHKIKIIQVDNRSEPQQAPVAAQKAIEQGADVLLVSCEVLTAAAAAPVAEEHDMLNFTMCANEPGFGPPTTSRLSFSASPSLSSEASAEAYFLHDKGIERPFLLRDTSIVFGKLDCSAFQETWEHLGGEIAGSADFKNEDESIASQVNELENSDADAVMLCSYPPGGAAAIKQIRAAGIDLPIALPAAFDGTYWLKGIPNLGEAYLATNGSAYDPTNQATAKLFASLEKAGVNTDVSGPLLASYAAGQLILAALEETRSVDGNVLADALESKPHPTIVGNVKYTKDDHYPSRVWPIYVFSNGKPKFVTEVNPEFIPDYGG